MVHKPPEPEGEGCLSVYILDSDLSLVVISKYTWKFTL